MSKWKPIETAPKDGTEVLVCQAASEGCKAIDWRKQPMLGIFCQVAAWRTNDDGSNGAWVVYCSMVKDPDLFFKPTHWRRLPKPPKVATPP